MQRPLPAEYAEFYATYVDKVPDQSVVDVLREQRASTAALLASIGEERAAYRYAPEKWSIKQLVAHLIDSERMFAYRAMTFARGDGVELPGFDEGLYSRANRADERSLESLARELADLRASHLALFEHLNAEEGLRAGIASGCSVTVRALASIIAGHETHHVWVLRERYLD